MIIDMHVHHHLGPERASPLKQADALIALADRAGIDRLCLLGNVVRFGRHSTPRQVRAVNDVTVAQVRHRPDRLAGFCFLNPRHGARFIDAEVRRCIAEGPLVGIKLWVDVSARDRRLDPIMRRAAALKVPVLQHAWYKTTGRLPGESEPSDVAHLARRHPAATIIMAHLVGGGIRGVLDVQPCPNVFVDTSGSQPVAGVIEYAAAKLGAERIVFGSDLRVRDFSCQLGKVYGAALTARQRRLILGDNAARLLGLSEAAAS
jgi:predicted TIM-barrel fold metal-dependent hydrolase